MRRRLFTALLALGALAQGGLALAQQAAPANAAANTLDEVVRRGRLIVAIGLGAPPFGTTNAQMQPDGYDVDVARALARDMGVELEIVPTTAQNRIPYLQTSRVDLVISSFSVTAERARAIAFTIPYGGLQQVAVARRDLALASTADLAGKRIGVARGTTNDTLVTQLNPQGARISRYDDDALASQALLSRQVDVIVTSDSLGVALARQNPQAGLENRLVLSSAPFSFGIRRHEPDWLHFLNTWIYLNRQNGTLNRLFEKWFERSMPEMGSF
jgi:polar amino acid transport system substrate-binding protein